MQYTPQELKARLLKALDEENNVVDAEGVLGVISILETYPITREQLESTRIGRYVNELRKKTTNEALAKRAKKLVRSWQRLISDVPEGGGSLAGGLNGERLDTPPLPRNVAALQASIKSCPSPPVNAYSPATSPKVTRGNVSSSLAKKSSLSPAPVLSSAPSNVSPRLPPAREAGGSLRKQVTTPGAYLGRVASPAVARASSPHVSTLASPRVSPHLAGRNLPSKLVSPTSSPGSAQGKSRTASPTVSPGLVGKSRVASPCVSPALAARGGRVASPAVSPGVASSKSVPLRVHSPVPSNNLPQRVSSPATVPSRVISPRVSHLSRTETAGSSRQSPKFPSHSPLQPAPPARVHSPNVPLPSCPEGNEDSNFSWPASPASVTSDGDGPHAHPASRLAGSESAPLHNYMHIRKSNHSTDSISKSGGRSLDSHMTNTSKTDVANRKRTRTGSPVGFTAKKARMSETPGLSHSLSGDDVVNGSRKGYRSKNGEKAKWVSGFREAGSLDIERPGTPDSCASGSNSKKFPLAKTLSVCSDSASKMTRTSKVKTTAQLIADLQKKSSSASVGNDIIEKLNTNQIVKEQDVQNSVLPPGIKPRSRRKKEEQERGPCSVPSSSISMKQAKTEFVQKFLDSFDDDFQPCPRRSDPLPSRAAQNLSPVPGSSAEPQPANEDSDSSASPAPAQQQHKIPSLEEINSQLSPLNLDSIDWGSLDYSVPASPPPVQEEDVEQLLSQPVPHVNGCYDSRGQWRDWTETYTVSYPDSRRMHVLPYVILD